jgi:PPM family protein phosphatase
MVADMIRRGQLTEAESRYHPNRSVITRALGTDPNMLADTYEFDAEPGDRLLLCSDGLTGMLEDGLICEILTENSAPEDAARVLIDTANDAGGHDNISVVIIDIEGTGSPRGSVIDATGKRSGRGWMAVVGWVLLFALIVGTVCYGAYTYSRSRAYFAIENGQINAYRGVPGSFAGLSLSWPLAVTGIEVYALPPDMQAKLKAGVEFPYHDFQSMLELYRSKIPTPAVPSIEPPGSLPNTSTTTTPTL